MSPAPLISVIVPVYQGEHYLARTLEALVANDLPREEWELIVVDDGSTDRTAEVAAPFADQVVQLAGPPGGPAHARNRGAAVARGAWLFFVDADVMVHADVLRLVRDATHADPGLAAVFGTYDDAPPAPGFVSQFRNLMHRYVHLRSVGQAETFWAGCGAVRRNEFMAVGGFDATRYPRPMIEDIELGYRLSDRGARIEVLRGLQGAHLKNWTFWSGTRADLKDRGVPWVRLLLERGRLTGDANLNLQRGERFKTALVGLAAAVLAATPWLGWAGAGAALTILLLVTLRNAPALRWFARLRGPAFALGAAGMLLWYHLVSGVSVVLAIGQSLVRPSRTGRPEPAPADSRTTQPSPTE